MNNERLKKIEETIKRQKNKLAEIKEPNKKIILELQIKINETRLKIERLKK